MRRVLTTAAILLLTAACATPRGYGPSPDWSPLEAYIVSPERDLTFHVSRPAYVAMFEISPGAYTRLMYPMPGQGRADGYVYGGDRVWHGGGFMRPEMTLTSHSWARPRFVFLIASDQPLRLDAFGQGGYSMRSAMGFMSYASADPYDAMERLVDIALPPMVSDGEWATDFYVYWPQVLESRVASRRVLVECNGYHAWVPIEFEREVWREICAPRQANEGRNRPGDDGDDDKREGETVQPGRRAPIPRDGVGARTFKPTSRQLQQPVKTRPERRPVQGGRITAGDAGGDDAGSTGSMERPERGRDGVGDAERPRSGAPAGRGEPAGRESPARGQSRPERGRPAEPGGSDPRGHAEPVGNPAPAVPVEGARPAEPVSRPAARPEPAETQPIPETRPAPEAPPTEITRPAPEPRPTPEVKPAPDARSAPAARPAPEPRTTPEARPAPSRQSRPARVTPASRTPTPTAPAKEGGGDNSGVR